MENRIGILTWHYYENFGSALQAFALQKTVISLGYDVTVINYRDPQFGRPVWWRKIVKKFLKYTIAPFDSNIRNKVISETEVFQNKNIHQSKVFYEETNLISVAKEFDCIIYGSDQIWAPNVYNPVYMGRYVEDGIRKISYAASIGLNDIPEKLVEEYKTNLSSFYAISVREQEGQDLLKARCNLDVFVVLDPTLLIDANVYRKMYSKPSLSKDKYIFCYFLNKNHEYRKVVEKYAQKHDLYIFGVSYKEDDSSWLERLTNIGPEKFLWMIDHADTIFTDSYHGTIFSLLFHKDFWTFVRFEENNPICQNSRIRQLQKVFHIENRVISSNSEINDVQPIDYIRFENQLSEFRKSSLSYLRFALE